MLNYYNNQKLEKLNKWLFIQKNVIILVNLWGNYMIKEEQLSSLFVLLDKLKHTKRKDGMTKI